MGKAGYTWLVRYLSSRLSRNVDTPDSFYPHVSICTKGLNPECHNKPSTTELQSQVLVLTPAS